MKNLMRHGIFSVVFLSVLLGIGIIGALHRPPVEEKTVDLLAEAPAHSEEKTAAAAEEQAAVPFEEYETVFGERDIFQMPAKDGGGLVPSLSGGAEEAGPFDQQYLVVGILVDEDPRAVVQDKQTHETFFLSVGGSLNDATVEQILPHTVIFNRYGKRFEMNLSL